MSIEKTKTDEPKREHEQPIDSWVEKDFISHGKVILKSVKRFGSRAGEKDFSPFEFNMMRSSIRDLYRTLKESTARGHSITLEDLGTSEERLKEIAAPSRFYNQEQRDGIWQRVMFGSEGENLTPI